MGDDSAACLVHSKVAVHTMLAGIGGSTTLLAAGTDSIAPPSEATLDDWTVQGTTPVPVHAHNASGFDAWPCYLIDQLRDTWGHERGAETPSLREVARAFHVELSIGDFPHDFFSHDLENNQSALLICQKK
jgi:hypothetical protein